MNETLHLIEYDDSIICEFNRFRCGNKYLDEYIYCADDKERKTGKTYIWINIETKDIVGYFTISPSAIILKGDADLSVEEAALYEEIDDRSEVLDIHKILIKKKGAIGIDCFAINDNFQGKIYNSEENLRYSEQLLEILFDQIRSIAELLDTETAILYSTPAARKLYLNFGFEFLNYSDKKIFYESIYQTCPAVSEDERERNNRYLLIANKSDIDSTPMIINIDLNGDNEL